MHYLSLGIPDDRDGLFDTIQRSKNHHQKRAYQCIKCMVTLFVSCPAAVTMLQSNGDLKRKWSSAVEWLNDELERVSSKFIKSVLEIKTVVLTFLYLPNIFLGFILDN